jgi:hypothetical protein
MFGYFGKGVRIDFLLAYFEGSFLSFLFRDDHAE